MNPAPNVTPDAARTPDGQARPRWSTPGFSDGLGDRVLMFDQTTATLLEVLRFKREFGSSPAFETALRERVERLRHIHHPSLAVVRGVENLAGGEGLALVSKQTAGRRLSDLLPEARGPVFAVESIRQLTPALARLQQSGDGIAHGALTTDRVVVTREGRLVIVEYVVGSALQSLRLPAARLRAEFGIAAPSSGVVAFDARADVIQLGLLALSLLLGRKIDPADYPMNMSARLDEFSRSEAGNSPASARLRKWLERALQLDARPFQTAQEAQDGFADTPAEAGSPALESEHAVLAFQTTEPAGAPEAHAEPVTAPSTPETHFPSEVALSFQSVQPAASMPTPAPAAAVSEMPSPRPSPLVAPSLPAPVPAAAPAAQSPAPQPRRASRWVVIGLGAATVAEAAVIAVLLYAQPATIVVEPHAARPDLPAAAALVAPLAAASDARTDNSAPPALEPPAPARPAPESATPPPAARPKADAIPAAAGERFGGIRVTSPLDLQVFEGGKLLGSSAGPIAISEGTHSIDVVNDALSFSAHETVDVKAGQMAALTVTPPTARVSINALPWADVTIDGNPAGETPIANLSLPIGRHEVVFRHPQLGEQRQTVMVKAGVLTRVSVSLQK